MSSKPSSMMERMSAHKLRASTQRRESTGVGKTDDAGNNGEMFLDDNYKELEAVLSGMKEGLSHRDKKLTQLELHIQKGHIGYCPDCELCRSLKANQRRRYMVCDPHRVTQIGYKWGMDLISWKPTSLNGNNYTMVMRDYATGMFKLKHMAQ